MKIHRGFTLIEISVALAVLSIMAVATVPVVQTEVQRRKENELRVSLLQLRQAIDEFKRASDQGKIPRAADASGYPPNLEALAQGYTVLDGSKTVQLYFLRRIPRDPFATVEGATQSASKTWGLRSYASAPDRPEAGADVFDIFSRSNRVGRNGLEYSKW